MAASNSLLDALMVEVEAQAESAPPHHGPDAPSTKPDTLPSIPGLSVSQSTTLPDIPPNDTALQDQSALSKAEIFVETHQERLTQHEVSNSQNLPPQNPIQAPQPIPDASPQMSVDAPEPIMMSNDRSANSRPAGTEAPSHAVPNEGSEEKETVEIMSVDPAAEQGATEAQEMVENDSTALNPAMPTTQHDTQSDIEFIIPPTLSSAQADNDADVADQGAEWEEDSSPYDSSDSDSSDTTSSDDSDDDADGDYAMLDPEEAARILMQGDGGSDDEGGGPKDRSGAAGLRTANERVEEVIPKPDITITDEMKIEELGNVEFIVENTVVIKAKTSGEYQVLETNSLLCLENRSVLGVVADLIGRVEEPRYTIRFTNDQAIEEAGVSQTGTTIYYVPQHSTFVFTQPLKGVKGSDASNFHDEEVGDDEMEFSDDEAEAEHKRNLKMKRQNRGGESGRSRGGKPSRGSHRGDNRGRGGRNDRNDRGPQSTSASADFHTPEMNYDETPNGAGADDEYTPLQRPSNLFEMMANGNQALQHPLPPPPPPPGVMNTSRGDFGSRGRGFNRGGRGNQRPHRGRGGFNQSNGPSWTENHNSGFQSNHNTYNQHSKGTSHPPQLNLPATPSISALNAGYQNMSPSPITPLPNSSFNFGSMPPSQNFSFMQPQIPGLSNPAMQQFQQHFQQQQAQYQQYQQSQQQGQNPLQYSYQHQQPNQGSPHDPNQGWGR